MNTVSQVFKKHPIAITFLILYTLFCIRAVNLSFQMEERIKRDPGISGIAAGGEAVQHVYILLIITGGIFFFISSGYAIAKQTETKFYLCAIFIMIAETIAAFQIG
ncbi:MAG: hypothetical protein JWQ57_4872 [Mucilaginibacter sp.]|nr:hypothetical protein [Mucilaginibacter sp.]